MDPSLDSINHMLMEEDIATCSALQQRQDGDKSYQAILCSFYNIIGEHPPAPKSSLVSTSFESLSDHVEFNIPHQIAHEQHALQRYNGFNMSTHQSLNSGVSLANLQSIFFPKERGDTSCPVVPGLERHFPCPHSVNLNALSSQDYYGAIKFNDGQSLDTNVSCRIKKDIKGLNNFRSCRGNAHFHLPSPYKEFSLKLHGVELSFKDLKLHDHYVALYVREPSIPAGRPRNKFFGNIKENGDVAGKGCKSGKKRVAHTQEYVDFKELIVHCAQAVAVGDARLAHELLQHVRKDYGASADGNHSQRVAHYFSEALFARMRGLGSHHFRALLHDKPSAVTILKSQQMCLEVSPVVKAAHYFANQSILKAAEGASRLHIVDYGLECGIQWPFLINALADQKGGPPLLVITGIDSPQPGNNPAGRLEETGQRLAEHARTYNVPFQYHAIASSRWEDLDSPSFHFHEDEVLVVNCINSLRRIADESVLNLQSVSPREKLLMRIHSLKPHRLIIADVSATYNSSMFVSRVREALYCYDNLFDMLYTVWSDSPERLLKERTYYGDILNIVACEGAERVERAETYKQWQVRIERAGFEQLLIPPEILARSRSHAKQHYHKDFFVYDDAKKWMLAGWRGRTLVAVSAWKVDQRRGGRVMQQEKTFG